MTKLGQADPDCAWCRGTGKRKEWDIDPEADQYDWIDKTCECTD